MVNARIVVRGSLCIPGKFSPGGVRMNLSSDGTAGNKYRVRMNGRSFALAPEEISFSHQKGGVGVANCC
jgi:hypothetical protein